MTVFVSILRFLSPFMSIWAQINNFKNPLKTRAKPVNTRKMIENFSSVEVTNKKKKSKNNQARLKLFLDFLFFQSGALMDVAKQNPFVIYLIISKLERFFFYILFSKRSLVGCCKAKSIRESFNNQTYLKLF